MDISIIIGLLIALVIVCATTIVNNIISNNYKELGNKWDSRTNTITDITLCVGNLNMLIKDFADNGKTTDTDKAQIYSMMSNINRLIDDIKDYEANNY